MQFTHSCQISTVSHLTAQNPCSTDKQKEVYDVSATCSCYMHNSNVFCNVSDIKMAVIQISGQIKLKFYSLNSLIISLANTIVRANMVMSYPMG